MDTFGGENINGPFVANDPEQGPSKTTDLYGRARNAFIFKVYLVLCGSYSLTQCNFWGQSS